MRHRTITFLNTIYNQIIHYLKKFLKDHTSVFLGRPDYVVALATIILAYLTLANVSLNRELAEATKKLAAITIDQSKATQEMAMATKDMAEETKRLADITVEQFKIKSYPTFLIEWLEVKLDADTLFQKYQIRNLGEMTAHKVSFMQVFFDSIKIYCCKEYLTDELQRTTAMSIEKKILSNMALTVVNRVYLPNNFIVMHSIIFVRFEVPYDSIYLYETYGYYLEKPLDETSELSKSWDIILDNNKLELINRFRNKLPTLSQAFQSFLADYEP